jgi:hypothetical protein
MPFYISFTLLTGTGTRFAATAADALIAYNELRNIDAGAITIRDENGETFSVEQLTLAATPPKLRRDREGDLGA